MENVEVRMTHTSNILRVKVVEPRENRSFSFSDLFDPDTWSGHNHRSPIVDFELTVPFEINLDFSNDEGDVIVTSIQGDVDIEIDEGDINLNEIQYGELNLYADEGDIVGKNIKNAEGNISIEVDEGDVVIEDVSAKRLDVETDEGEIAFKELSCESCNITTDEGDIELDVILEEDSRYHVYADEGNVYFYLPKNPDVRFNLGTEHCAIRSDFDLKIKKDDDWQQCLDQIGSGASSIKVFTDEGIISVRKR